jgi:hypothetical protein
VLSKQGEGKNKQMFVDSVIYFLLLFARIFICFEFLFCFVLFIIGLIKLENIIKVMYESQYSCLWRSACISMFGFN